MTEDAGGVLGIDDVDTIALETVLENIYRPKEP
jgi:hypothetical protein